MTGTEETETEPTPQAMLEETIGKAGDYLAEVREAIDATPAGEHNRPAMLTLKVQLALAVTSWAVAVKQLAGDELDDDGDDELEQLEHRVAELDRARLEAERELELARRRIAELERDYSDARELIEAERDLTQHGQVRIGELEKQAKLDAAELDERGIRIDVLEQAAKAAGVDVDALGELVAGVDETVDALEREGKVERVPDTDPPRFRTPTKRTRKAGAK